MWAPPPKTVTPPRLASAGRSIPVATHWKVSYKTLPPCVVHLSLSLVLCIQHVVSSTLELHVCATLVQLLFVLLVQCKVDLLIFLHHLGCSFGRAHF
jgi:hypothetical protein